MRRKQLPHPDKMTSIINHLERQDKTLAEILIVIRGSVSLGVEGAIDKLKVMEKTQQQIISDVAHLQRWKKQVIEGKGKITFTWWDAGKIVFSIIGIAGTIVAMFLGLKQIFENPTI